MQREPMIMKGIRCCVLLLVTVGEVHAQQQVMFTQYMFNGLAINPAYAGSSESLSLTALMREQWTGIDGAPSTQTFSVHSPLKKERVSLGLLFLRDKIGLTKQTGLQGSFAYRIPVSQKGKLAFGIQGGATFYNANLSKVSVTDFAFNDVRFTQPNIGFGMYYNTDRFYAGISTPQLIETAFNKNNPDSDSRLVRHYFASTGYVFDVGPMIKLKPNLLIKAVAGAPVELDLNLNVLLRDVVWVGASWRTFDSFDALLQLQLTEQFQVGYAYDFATTTDLKRVNGGSHEVMINYRMTFTKNKMITPRYF
jgi:type IX secretion system PorP/SprF family membrane protein